MLTSIFIVIYFKTVFTSFIYAYWLLYFSVASEEEMAVKLKEKLKIYRDDFP